MAAEAEGKQLEKISMAVYYGHDIDVFCTEDIGGIGYVEEKKQRTISGTIPCPSGKPNCCLTCPVRILGQRQVGIPFEFTEKIGQGGFASVYVGKWNNEEAAFKMIPTKRNGWEYTTNSNGPYEMVIQNVLHANNPDLVDKPRGHFFVETDDQLYFCFVMKKHVSNLYQMNKAGTLCENHKKRVVERLVELQETLTCHGDIKLS